MVTPISFFPKQNTFCNIVVSNNHFGIQRRLNLTFSKLSFTRFSTNVSVKFYELAKKTQMSNILCVFKAVNES